MYGWVGLMLFQFKPLASKAALELLTSDCGMNQTWPIPLDPVVLYTDTMLCSWEVFMFISTTPASLPFMLVRPEVTCEGEPDCVRSIPDSCQPSAIAFNTPLPPERNGFPDPNGSS